MQESLVNRSGNKLPSPQWWTSLEEDKKKWELVMFVKVLAPPISPGGQASWDSSQLRRKVMETSVTPNLNSWVLRKTRFLKCEKFGWLGLYLLYSQPVVRSQ